MRIRISRRMQALLLTAEQHHKFLNRNSARFASTSVVHPNFQQYKQILWILGTSSVAQQPSCTQGLEA